MSSETRVQYEFPNNVSLVGTGPNMGNWEGQLALPIRDINDGKVTFSLDLLPPYLAFEFKVILITKLGEKLWSNGENYKVQENGTIEVSPEKYT
jgi:hypothetical protein